MKKITKIVSVILCMMLVLAFAGCSGNGNSGNDKKTASSKYVFSYYGIEMPIGEDASAIVDSLGEPISYFEAESCAFDGIDKTYTYSEFVLITYPDGDTDRVSTIRLTSDTVSTPEGVELGSSLDDVVAAYGDGYVQDVNSYIYTDGNCKLMFVITDDVVTSITYALAD